MQKFKALPNPAQSAELAEAVQRLEAARGSLVALSERAAELTERSESLSREESSVSAAIKTAQREDSRRIATGLAAIRIEISEAQRQREEITASLVSATTELRKASGEVGRAIEGICRGFFDDAKAAVADAVAAFFSKPEAATQFARTTQTDMDRAVLNFSQSFRQDFREADEALSEATRRLDVARKIEIGHAVFEWKSAA